MNDQSQKAQAIRRVNARLALYVHLAVYVAVNALLIVINLATSTGYLWFWWPLFGWGLGLALHALALIAIPRIVSIRRRMIERELGT